MSPLIERLRGRLHLLVGVCSVALVLSGTALLAGNVASAAGRNPDPAGQLVVASTPDPAHWTAVEPGDVIDWRIRVGLRGAPRGALTLKLSGRGPLLGQGLRIAVDACTVTETTSGCDQAARPILAEPLASGSGGRSWALGQLDSAHPVDLFVTLAVPDTARMSDQRTTVGIGVFATGDGRAMVQTDNPLADTGVDVLGPAMLGLGLIGLGVAASLAHRRRAA